MHRYLITYRQSPHGETERTVYRGYDAQHAEERFMDQGEMEGGNEGVTVLDVYKIPKIRRSPLLSEIQYRARFQH